MSSPLVSVVLPTYERPDKLRRAVRSVADQMYEPLELVVVDDASPTPATESLSGMDLDGLETEYIRHEHNRGANEARNTGIGASEGEYVAFLDDDDEWLPTKLEQQVEAFERAGPDVGVVYTGIEYEHGGYTRTEINEHRGDVTTDILDGQSFGTFSTLMVRRQTVDEAGLPDTAFPSWQDREWLLRLSTYCKFEPVTEPLTIRWVDDSGDRITDNFEEKRDVSYPRFLGKHRGLAASYGEVYERKLIASLSKILGKRALNCGYYADARKFLLRSLYYYPRSFETLVYALAALGGRYSYKPLSYLVRSLHGID